MNVGQFDGDRNDFDLRTVNTVLSENPWEPVVHVSSNNGEAYLGAGSVGDLDESIYLVQPLL